MKADDTNRRVWNDTLTEEEDHLCDTLPQDPVTVLISQFEPFPISQ